MTSGKDKSKHYGTKGDVTVNSNFDKVLKVRF